MAYDAGFRGGVNAADVGVYAAAGGQITAGGTGAVSVTGAANVNSAFGGFIDASDAAGFELIPVVSVWATPSGMVTGEAIRQGARADLVVLDPRKVVDVATFDDPHRYPIGIEHVMVNGRFVIKEGEHTGSLPGKVLSPS